MALLQVVADNGQQLRLSLPGRFHKDKSRVILNFCCTYSCSDTVPQLVSRNLVTKTAASMCSNFRLACLMCPRFTSDSYHGHLCCIKLNSWKEIGCKHAS